MRPVTCWLRYDEKRGVWKHNHIEFGRAEGCVPTPQSEEQAKSWPSAKWAKTYAFINENSEIVQEAEPYYEN